ncbi:serine threonine protein kinase [Vairimorpha apis BRL 01]|uniref:Serine threonine protein kinase n=1 Tax=Vairimorpha apis BRL 01 TaxID=1037528 RepID=T0MGQ4_9MICR|nr:serine threonine protein kinase [Vairimorpha apis BRL 01]
MTEENKENLSLDTNKTPEDNQNNEENENKENKNTENDDKKEKVNREEIVGDILANNPLVNPNVQEEEESRTFTKKEVLQSKKFSWLKLNEYLDYKFQFIPVTIRLSLISDNILYISLNILDIFKIQINEIVIEILQVVRATNYYLSMCVTSFLIVLAYHYTINKYILFANKGGAEFLILTLVLGYGCTMGLFFIEKFFLNFCTAEIRRREYRSRIWDINYKIFVFKKLVAISKAKPHNRKELGEEMIPDYDPGFYVKQNGLKLDNKKDATDIAESIFAYLGVQNITYENLKIYFPENTKEIYEYLANKKINEEDNLEPLKFEEISNEAVKLQVEKNDMSRTLVDRESIFNKLDLILSVVVTYIAVVILLILFNIDYKVYLATIGPAFFTFGWIFSDTIKEIYNCFVFLLVKHPYDIGDRVIIDDKEYIVFRTDVLSSSFIDINGKLCYIPTPVLFNKTIFNIRRSRKQSEILTLLCGSQTKFKDAINLKEQLSNSLAEKKHDFTGYVEIYKFEIDGGNISFSVLIEHISNFQQETEKIKRREMCVDIVEKTLTKCGITYNNSFKFED